MPVITHEDFDELTTAVSDPGWDYLTSLPAAAASTQPDPGETICFARPGFPLGADEEQGSVLAFGRTDTATR